jgi:hypothetical protein
MYNRIIKWFRSFFVNSTIKEQEDMRELDFKISEDKLKHYERRTGNKFSMKNGSKGLISCPMCKGAYTATEWPIHRHQELNRRKGKAKADFKGEDGMFRCVVPGCVWSKGGHN